jgi:aminopeptidase N
MDDAFWAVQNEAARALGTMRTSAARDALLECVKVKHPKARRGVVAALGQFRHDERAAAALESVLRKGDASYYVEAAAAQALGQTRSPRAFDVLSEVAMSKDSQSDVIRAQALAGLCELKDERALPIAIEWTRPGRSNPVRGAATFALGRVGQLSDRAKDTAFDRLVELLPDEWLRVRLNAIAALAELKDTKAIAELERTRDRDLDGRVIRAAREAVRRIGEGADKGEEVRRLRDDLDKLAEENRSLKDRIEKLEAGTNGTAPRPGARKKTPAKKPTKAATRKPAPRRQPTRTPARRVAAARSRR